MPDYSKYDDKVTLNKDRDKLTPDLQALYDFTAEEETQRILDRLRSNPHMLRSVATKLAQEALLKATNDDNTE
jgi:hypothetical protein